MKHIEKKKNHKHKILKLNGIFHLEEIVEDGRITIRLIVDK